MAAFLLRLLFVTASGSFALAQTPAGPPPPPEECRQFDFWLGEWDVTSPDGRPAGTNRIEKIAGGWGIIEHWQGVAGGAGKSLNAYHPARRAWQQFWVGMGGILELSGGLNPEGEMVLNGESRGRDGRVRLDRVTWTPRADGTVRQHWQVSTDSGATWTTSFDGLYRRRAGKPSPAEVRLPAGS